jgi:2'-5' RNA ligase
MSEKTRSFIAIQFPQSTLDFFQRTQDKLISKTKDRKQVKWVKPHNMHITLQFLGDVDSAQINDLKDGLKNAFVNIPAFELDFKSVGAYPSLKKPRVIWIGVNQGREQVIELFNQVHLVTGPLGFEKENRPFSPHITIGRLRDPKKSGNLSNVLGGLGDIGGGKCQIREVELVASELTPQGPIYSKLDNFTLGK